MAPDKIVEAVDSVGNGLLDFDPGIEDGSPNELGFDGLEEPRPGDRSHRPHHQSLLQPRPAPFRARRHQPASVREAGRTTLKTLSTFSG